MTVCRFFQQGYCRYGNSCRFEHVYAAQKFPNQGPQNNQYQVVNQPQNNVTTEQLINQVSADTTAALNGHQWRLSSYGPFKCKPNFPGMTDISPEELRHQMYEARMNGSLAQIEAQIVKCISESTEKLKAICKPTGSIVCTIISLYKNETPEDPFLSNSFNVVQNTNMFGGNAMSVPTQNVFGGQLQTNPAPNIFGNPMQNNAPTNVFKQNPASSLFAEAAQNIFQAPTQNAFGTNTFGEPPKPTQVETLQNNNFGMMNTGFNQAQTPAMQQVNIFNSAVSQNTPNGNVFGQTQTSPSAVSMFGSTAGTPVVQDNIIFRQTPAAMQNPFGVQPSNIFQTPTSNSIFSKNNVNANGANPFEIQTKPDIRPELYSKIEELTEQDLEAFKKDSFLPGQIPEVPPPMELCE